MDTGKSGKVSRQEFINFISAEFDRLVVHDDGKLDVKEDIASPLRSSMEIRG